MKTYRYTVSVQFSHSVMSDSLQLHGLQHTRLRSLLKLISIELVMPSNHLIFCCPLLLPSIFPSIRVFSNELVLSIRWPKYWSFSFNISPTNEYSGFIYFRMDWMWSTGERNGKPLQYSCLENPMNSMKRQNDRILKEELPRSVGAQYATRDQWRNNSRKNEGMEPKQKQYPAVDVTGDRSKVWCCKEHYCIGTWNVRSMNQGKLEVVKQEMARVNVNILGISELKWTEWMNLTQMTIISTTVGRNPLEEME